MTYFYDPKRIKARGKDQMRFELGDTLVDGGAETCALADEEYEAVLDGIEAGKKAWLFAKLAVLEAILFKISYQVNTKIDVLSYDFGDRAERWQKLYDQIKKDVLATASVPTMAPDIQAKPPYFYAGMEENHRANANHIDRWPFRNITE